MQFHAVASRTKRECAGSRGGKVGESGGKVGETFLVLFRHPLKFASVEIHEIRPLLMIGPHGRVQFDC